MIETAGAFGGLRDNNVALRSSCRMPELAIREAISTCVARPEDAAALADLHIRSAQQGFKHIFSAEALDPSKDELTSDWTAWLWANPALDRKAITVKRGDRIVGVIVTGLDHKADPTLGRLTRAYVNPEVWGSRVAQLMFNAAIGRLREIGCTRAVTWIMEPNHRARKTVEHLGMRITGKRQPTCERAAASGCSAVEDVEYEISIPSG
jgi:RimJ/RimL family protein N-acetyltransferase